MSLSLQIFANVKNPIDRALLVWSKKKLYHGMRVGPARASRNGLKLVGVLLARSWSLRVHTKHLNIREYGDRAVLLKVSKIKNFKKKVAKWYICEISLLIIV